MLGKDSIFLIGPMGSGKTAVAKYLARLLDYPFHDSDHEIERRCGADIALIFDREGEAGFRRREREVIAELTSCPRIVLATGGGAILHADNRRDLASRGCVVYLETSIAQQAERAGRTRHRPLLQDTDPMVRLEELMRLREPLYREIADLIAPTDRKRVPAVAERIAQDYKASLMQPAPAGVDAAPAGVDAAAARADAAARIDD
jgi:shikimate kinase